MRARPELYHAQPDSELWHLLDRAEIAPLLVEKEGKRFRIVRDAADPFADYDPKAVREAIHAAAGILVGVDRDELLADLRAQRGQDSTGRPAE